MLRCVASNHGVVADNLVTCLFDHYSGSLVTYGKNRLIRLNSNTYIMGDGSGPFVAARIEKKCGILLPILYDL